MRKFGLIGYPLGHSFSVGYFGKKFKNEGIQDACYVNFPIESIDELPGIIQSEKNLEGLNVTIPYKQKVMPFLDHIDPEAGQIGAVNTLKVIRKREKFELYGYNTDSWGFAASLQEFPGFRAEKALVLGTGGASLAVIHALEKMNVKTLSVSRNPSRGQISYTDINEEIMKSHTLIVNSTPLGTFPDTGKAPDIPYSFITSAHFLYDLVYNPAETLFMVKGKEKGALVKNGYSMLVEQAEKAWKIWNENYQHE